MITLTPCQSSAVRGMICKEARMGVANNLNNTGMPAYIICKVQLLYHQSFLDVQNKVFSDTYTTASFSDAPTWMALPLASSQLGKTEARLRLHSSSSPQHTLDIFQQLTKLNHHTLIHVYQCWKPFQNHLPSECRHCRLTSDIFTKEFFTSTKYSLEVG